MTDVFTNDSLDTSPSNTTENPQLGRKPTRHPTPFPSSIPTKFPTPFPTMFPTAYPTTIDKHPSCPPGHRLDTHANICIECLAKTYNHGGMQYRYPECYTIPNESTFMYLNTTDVQCKKGWYGIPIYEDGEYDDGCTNIPSTKPVTPYPSFFPSFAPTTDNPTHYPTIAPTTIVPSVLALTPMIQHLSTSHIVFMGVSGFFGLFGLYYLYIKIREYFCRRQSLLEINEEREVSMITLNRDGINHLPPHDGMRIDNLS